MKTITAASMLVVSLATRSLVFLVGAARAQEDWQAVAQALGKSGTAAGGVYRVGLPRTDIKATLDNALRLAAIPKAALAHINIAKS
jgi:phosphohistidine phosphatase SixA